MSTTGTSILEEASLPLSQIEQALSQLVSSVKEPGEGPAQRARMSNLVVYCDDPTRAASLSAEFPSIVATHPARVLMLIAEPRADPASLQAVVNAWCQDRGSVKTCSEEIRLNARGSAVDRLPFVVRGLLIGDLPTNVWWASIQPPPLAGPILYDLTEFAQQIIYDSVGWLEPARGVAATAAWLERFERDTVHAGWRVASDLNWRRLKYWRRLLGQALDPKTAPGVLESVTEVYIEHGPHAVIQAWELVSWLAARLNWKVQGGRVQPGVELCWQCDAPHGKLRIRVHRLAAGPSQVHKVRIACQLDGNPGAMNFVADDSLHLSVQLEGRDVSPRTVTIQSQNLAELVGRQLSDRERDLVFRDSMTVAAIMAESLLHG